MKNFTKKPHRYDNYVDYEYIDNSNVLHTIYFKKKDYRRPSSCVLYSKSPIKIINRDGYSVRMTTPSEGMLQHLINMPRYNAKKIENIANFIGLLLDKYPGWSSQGFDTELNLYLDNIA